MLQKEIKADFKTLDNGAFSELLQPLQNKDGNTKFWHQYIPEQPTNNETQTNKQIITALRSIIL